MLSESHFVAASPEKGKGQLNCGVQIMTSWCRGLRLKPQTQIALYHEGREMKGRHSTTAAKSGNCLCQVSRTRVEVIAAADSGASTCRCCWCCLNAINDDMRCCLVNSIFGLVRIGLGWDSVSGNRLPRSSQIWSGCQPPVSWECPPHSSDNVPVVFSLSQLLNDRLFWLRTHWSFGCN